MYSFIKVSAVILTTILASCAPDSHYENPENKVVIQSQEQALKYLPEVQKIILNGWKQSLLKTCTLDSAFGIVAPPNTQNNFNEPPFTGIDYELLKNNFAGKDISYIKVALDHTSNGSKTTNEMHILLGQPRNRLVNYVERGEVPFVIGTQIRKMGLEAREENGVCFISVAGFVIAKHTMVKIPIQAAWDDLRIEQLKKSDSYPKLEIIKNKNIVQITPVFLNNVIFENLKPIGDSNSDYNEEPPYSNDAVQTAFKARQYKAIANYFQLDENNPKLEAAFTIYDFTNNINERDLLSYNLLPIDGNVSPLSISYSELLGVEKNMEPILKGKDSFSLLIENYNLLDFANEPNSYTNKKLSFQLDLKMNGKISDYHSAEIISIKPVLNTHHANSNFSYCVKKRSEFLEVLAKSDPFSVTLEELVGSCGAGHKLWLELLVSDSELIKIIQKIVRNLDLVDNISIKQNWYRNGLKLYKAIESLNRNPAEVLNPNKDIPFFNTAFSNILAVHTLIKNNENAMLFSQELEDLSFSLAVQNKSIKEFIPSFDISSRYIIKYDLTSYARSNLLSQTFIYFETIAGLDENQIGMLNEIDQLKELLKLNSWIELQIHKIISSNKKIENTKNLTPELIKYFDFLSWVKAFEDNDDLSRLTTRQLNERLTLYQRGFFEQWALADFLSINHFIKLSAYDVYCNFTETKIERLLCLGPNSFTVRNGLLDTGKMGRYLYLADEIIRLYPQIPGRDYLKQTLIKRYFNILWKGCSSDALISRVHVLSAYLVKLRNRDENFKADMAELESLLGSCF